MAALQFVDTPGYAALILMKNFADLSLPGAGMSRMRDWLGGVEGARPVDGGRAWHFPSGASVNFGYLDNIGDEQRYRTAEFQFVAFDELTRFDETPYRFLFSRLRRLKGSEIPIRMRAGTNPGGRGHEWVKRCFLPQAFLDAAPAEAFGRHWWSGDKLFVPARLEDNTYLDRADYELSLHELDPVTRAQLRSGDWKAHAEGRFRRQWFPTYADIGDAIRFNDSGDVLRKEHFSRGVMIDPAGRKTKSSKFTAMLTFATDEKSRLVILDMVREQLAVETIIPTLDALCARQRPHYVGIEDNGFQLMLVQDARDRSRFRSIPTVHELPTEGKSKLTRATPAILKAERGGIYLPADDRPWLEDFAAELCQFTGDEKLDAYTDQVDTLAYAVLTSDRFSPRNAGVPLLL